MTFPQRDPFGPLTDGALFWESERRAAIREESLKVLMAGRNLWLRGAAGAGRQTLLSQLVRELSRRGRRVLAVPDETARPDGPSFLSRLCAVAVPPAAQADDPLDQAAALYRSLWSEFCEHGTVIVVPGRRALGAAAVAEAKLLADLRYAGAPLAALALLGEGEPFLDAVALTVPEPDATELEEFLRHRCALCGRPDLLSPARLRALAQGAAGFDTALASARLELARLVYRGAVEVEDSPADASVSPSPAVPAEFAEVDRLLQSLAHESSVS